MFFCDAKGIACGGIANHLKNLQVNDMIEAMAGIVENIQTPNQTPAMQRIALINIKDKVAILVYWLLNLCLECKLLYQ